MKKRVKCIMLVDDDADDNFIHTRLIEKNDSADIVIINKVSAIANLIKQV